MHQDFSEPDKILIWRYLSFTKFVSLIETRSLYFATLQEMRQIDPFEGMLPEGNVRQRGTILDDSPQAKTEQEIDSYIKKVVVNCWHINQYESAAMWKLYLRSGEGVAIQSTISELMESLNIRDDHSVTSLDGRTAEIKLAPIKYVNYDDETIPENDLLIRVAHKDSSFIYEDEFRVIAEIKHDILNNNTPPTGAAFPVDLKRLIKHVITPPMAPDWIFSLTTSLLDRNGLAETIKRSKLKITMG